MLTDHNLFFFCLVIYDNMNFVVSWFSHIEEILWFSTYEVIFCFYLPTSLIILIGDGNSVRNAQE